MFPHGLKKADLTLSSLALSSDSIIAIAGVLSAALFIAGTQYIFCFIIAAKPGRIRWTRRVRLPPYCGFLSKTANTEQAELFVHAQGHFRVVVRHATLDDAPEWRSARYAPRRRKAHYDIWRGFAWSDPIVIPVTSLRDGPYIVSIVPDDRAEATYCIPMLVRHEWKSVIVVSSTNTWSAYNSFGGLSNYCVRAIPLPLRPLLFLFQSTGRCFRLSDGIIIPTIPLPERRPLQNIHEELSAMQSGRTFGASHLYRGELCLLRTLDKLGISYSVVSDEEVENFSVLRSTTKLAIFNTHSEYWSNIGMAALKNLIEHGASVAFLSGNNIYRRVQRTQFGLQVVDQMVDVDATARLIGAGYDALGYQTFAGYSVVKADHWVFSGCSALQSAGHFARGGHTAAHPGGSGHETDKIRPSSEGFQLIALGENPEGGACIVCRDLPDGRFVFNAASVSFTSMLEFDLSLPKIIENLVARALNGSKSLDAWQPKRSLRSSFDGIDGVA